MSSRRTVASASNRRVESALAIARDSIVKRRRPGRSAALGYLFRKMKLPPATALPGADQEPEKRVT